MYYTIDRDGDGMVSKDEFIEAFTPLPKPKKKHAVLLDPMAAAEKATSSRPVSAKQIQWKTDF